MPSGELSRYEIILVGGCLRPRLQCRRGPSAALIIGVLGTPILCVYSEFHNSASSARAKFQPFNILS